MSGIAQQAVDGNTSGYWNLSCSHTDEGPNLWWSVDLEITAYVTSIIITNRGDCCGERLSDFTLHVQDDVSQLRDSDTVCNGAESFGAAVTREFVCQQNVIGRYVNVTKTSTSALTLCEVDVCGTESPIVSCGVKGFLAVAGRCIRLHYEEADWKTANSTCQSEGSSLVKIETNSSNRAIKTFLQTHDILMSHSYYIGGWWSSDDARYTWGDGTPIEFTAGWQTGHPQEPEDGRCVVLDNTSNMSWKDSPCGNLLWFICELK
ncbi:lithostathine-1-beta-like [Gigantopelta aegis]|uniref:lithostathine-1-beta-like n=1 Tax=Gigantopelta aegis TaxID=1735272 RepID=UPI001B88D30A|nr:lithostathine-1-beta-like [Gigantopelta aegis]